MRSIFIIFGVSWCRFIFLVSGGYRRVDPAADEKIAFHSHETGRGGPDQIIQDSVGDLLVEGPNIAVGPEVKFQALQLYTKLLRNVSDPDRCKIGLSRLRAKTGKLGDPNSYGVIPLRVRVSEPLETAIRSGLSGRSDGCGHSVGSLARESSAISFCRAFYFTLAPSKQLSRPDYLLD